MRFCTMCPSSGCNRGPAYIHSFVDEMFIPAEDVRRGDRVLHADMMRTVINAFSRNGVVSLTWPPGDSNEYQPGAVVKVWRRAGRAS